MSYRISVRNEYCLGLPTTPGEPVIVALDPNIGNLVIIASAKAQLLLLAMGQALSAVAYNELMGQVTGSGLPWESNLDAVLIPDGAARTIYCALEATRNLQQVMPLDPGGVTRILVPDKRSLALTAAAHESYVPDALMVIGDNTPAIHVFYAKKQGYQLLINHAKMFGSTELRTWRQTIESSILPGVSEIQDISVTGEPAQIIGIAMDLLLGSPEITYLRASSPGNLHPENN